MEQTTNLPILLTLIFGLMGIITLLIVIFKSLKTEIKDVKTEIKNLDTKLSTEIKNLDTKLSTEIKNLDTKLLTEIKEVRIELKELDNKWSQTREDFFKTEKENTIQFNQVIRNIERMERQHQEHLTYFHKISNKK